MVELMDFRTKLQPRAGIDVICHVMDNAPAAPLASSGALEGGANMGAAGVVAMLGQMAPPQQPLTGATPPMPPTGPRNTAGLAVWWSPLLPLLALPNMMDFRCVSCCCVSCGMRPLIYRHAIQVLRTFGQVWSVVTCMFWKLTLTHTQAPHVGL